MEGEAEDGLRPKEDSHHPFLYSLQGGDCLREMSSRFHVPLHVSLIFAWELNMNLGRLFRNIKPRDIVHF